MAWLCLKDNALSGSQMCIVTGPRIDLAIALIDRMKKLFAGKALITFDTKPPDITGSFDLEETSNSVSHIIFSLRYLTVEVLVVIVVVVLVGRVAFSRCFIILGC